MATTILNARVNATEPPSPTQNITNNTCCLILQLGSIGTERKVKSSQIKERGVEDSAVDTDAPVEVDAEKELLRVSKKLLVSPEFDAIQKHRGAFKRWLRTLTVPSLFKEGIYRVHYKAVPQITEKLKAFTAEDRIRVNAFLAVYRQRCDETREKLKALGESMDYPPVARVSAAFFIDYSWMTFSTDEKLRQEVSEEFFQEAKMQNELKMSQATDAIILMMREEAQGLVDHLIEVLQPNQDGTKKKFKKSTVEKLKEFLTNFQLRNVTNDSQLELIVQSAMQLLDGVDADKLKKNEAVESQTLQGMTLVKQCLDGLVTEAGSRRITFADPEPEEAEEDAFAEVQ